MQTIGNSEQIEFRESPKNTSKHFTIKELILTIILFGSSGAIAWAIRGSSGWGGVDGTIVPGMLWGLLWYYVCYRFGIDARRIVFWLGFGIALGGELGYGQYVSWIRGIFYVGDGTLSISPLTGYLWLFLCGVGWAAPGGILLGWAIENKVSKLRWVIRSLLLSVLLLFLFAWPFVEWIGSQFVKFWPELLFPLSESGIYVGELDNHLQRTVYTNTQNFLVVVWWLVALFIALFKKERITLISGILLGAGFGLGFMQSAAWCLGYGFAPKYIDWWKMWEMNSGFNLGLLYALLLFLLIRWRHKFTDFNTSVPANDRERKQLEKTEFWQTTLFRAIAGAVLIFFMGFEYFFWPGIFLTLLYFTTMLLSGLLPVRNQMTEVILERQKTLLLLFGKFLFLFILFHGGSDQTGIWLGLYPEEAVDQYAWPNERILLFAPFAAVLLGVTLYRIKQILWPESSEMNTVLLAPNRPEHIINLITFMGFIGASSIWPAKIGIFYAFFLFTALFAFNRLNRRFDFASGKV